ncbi:hypothetical protein BD626DRAFT_540653 [Schizophyllum amplum]|uniref:Uncharacterized protein n=1 Tax=Schizophyllum amplum TaxID=97359 RepID=A0A550BXU3_9AGAR|nr:hypothetical protein BD626DRAFT_540653 [Auriculariopsis ampla]
MSRNRGRGSPSTTARQAPDNPSGGRLHTVSAAQTAPRYRPRVHLLPYEAPLRRNEPRPAERVVPTSILPRRPGEPRPEVPSELAHPPDRPLRFFRPAQRPAQLWGLHNLPRTLLENSLEGMPSPSPSPPASPRSHSPRASPSPSSPLSLQYPLSSPSPPAAMSRPPSPPEMSRSTSAPGPLPPDWRRSERGSIPAYGDFDEWEEDERNEDQKIRMIACNREARARERPHEECMSILTSQFPIPPVEGTEYWEDGLTAEEREARVQRWRDRLFAVAVNFRCNRELYPRLPMDLYNRLLDPEHDKSDIYHIRREAAHFPVDTPGERERVEALFHPLL